MRVTDLSRRALLGLAGVLPLAACTADEGPPPPPDPDDLLRSAAVARELALLAQYDAAVLALPDRAAVLMSVRAEHAAHLAALQAPSASPSAAPSPPPAPSPGPVSMAALVVAEREAGAAHAQAVLEASRELAGLLGSLAASEASHAVVLA